MKWTRCLGDQIDEFYGRIYKSGMVDTCWDLGWTDLIIVPLKTTIARQFQNYCPCKVECSRREWGIRAGCRASRGSSHDGEGAGQWRPLAYLLPL